MRLEYLLFLYDFGHFMIEGHLLGLTEFLLLTEEHHSALVIASVNSLNESAAFQNGVIVPLDLEHPPILLYRDSSISFLLAPLLCLATSTLTFLFLRT